MIDRQALSGGHVQSRGDGERETGALLFVRGADDLSCAVWAVNELLSQRRTPGSLDPEILGIVVGDGLDTSVVEGGQGGARPGSVKFTVRESVALWGIWSLCWFDLGAGAVCRHAGDRRRRLLDNLRVGPRVAHTGVSAQRLFFPVFTPAEAQGEVEVLLDDLEASYPGVAIGRERFVGGQACGAFLKVLRHDPPRRRRELR